MVNHYFNDAWAMKELQLKSFTTNLFKIQTSIFKFLKLEMKY